MIDDTVLHDATLDTITLDWAAGEVEVALRTGSGPRRIRASGVTQLSCPRVQEWGASVSVNEVRQVETIDEQRVLQIEMQSGDVIEIRAASFATDACS